jgi:hypothetical protein
MLSVEEGTISLSSKDRGMQGHWNAYTGMSDVRETQQYAGHISAFRAMVRLRFGYRE